MGKVLIIDDENQLRGLLARIIGLEGYEVIQAHTFPPRARIPTSNTSALIGMRVEARKEPINNPQYPKSINESMRQI